MPIPARHENWFRYFPSDYRWSAAVAGVLGTARYGGGEIGEVDQVGRRLRDVVGDDDAWFREWTRLGDATRGWAEEAERCGHGLTAAAAYLRACSYYQIGERFRVPKDESAEEVYRTALRCFEAHIELTDWPYIERVEVPYQEQYLPGYLVTAQRPPPDGSPCVVFFDGLDITKELQYLRGVPELVRRGISCLIVDGPGNGESIRFRGMPLRYDYDLAGSAALDYLEGVPWIDRRRIGVMGISLGGYYAPRCAALDPRFSACVAWGAIWDYYDTWARRVKAGFRTQLSVPGLHLSWVLGANDVDEALTRLADFRLEGVVQKIRCPFLVVHGSEDEQVPLADAQSLLDAAGSASKTLQAFTGDEGGSQHCQHDHLARATTFIADWLNDTL